MSTAEAAEFAKLADTTYRDVNIALANEFARYADRIGVDITEVIAAANSQPYSHIHQPGLGVGGHCIPVYPHFLLDRAPELELVALSRRVNDGQVDNAIRSIEAALGGLDGAEVLVLGLTYRDGVKELAYSRALPLIERLAGQGAHVLAYDPLLSDEEVARTGATPWRWGEAAPAVRAIVTQTADPAVARPGPGLVPGAGTGPRRTQLTARSGPAGRCRLPGHRSAPRLTRAGTAPPSTADLGQGAPEAPVEPLVGGAAAGGGAPGTVRGALAPDPPLPPDPPEDPRAEFRTATGTPGMLAASTLLARSMLVTVRSILASRSRSVSSRAMSAPYPSAPAA